MALAETTLAAAQGLTDTSVQVASATGLAPGVFLLIDGELEQVAKDYVSGTTANVLRGLGGTEQRAHVITARVTHGIASDFPNPGAGVYTNFPPAGRARQLTSVTATSTLTLAPAGVDQVVVLNGTSVITLTIPVPGKDKDGDRLTIVANGAAAHVPTFSSGLGGAGSSYDAITLNGTGTLALEVIACNELWCMPCAPAMGGTVTNIIGTIG